jgi:hypothetical protein
MFVYSHTVFRGVYLWTFRVTGKAVHAIAQFVQNGMIDRKHVDIHPFNKTLTVYVLNSRMFKLSNSECYLSLTNCPIKGYLDIDMVTEKGNFVPSWYRYYIKDITDETWITIFKNKTPPDQIDDYIYYGDEAYDEYLDDKYEIDIEENEDLYLIELLSDSCHDNQEESYKYEQINE